MTTLPVRQRLAWKALETHFAQVSGYHLRTLFMQDPSRGERFSAESEGIYLDYSKNRITEETIRIRGSRSSPCCPANAEGRFTRGRRR
jgi:glucose-6-phosphate isomerase